MLTTYPAVIRHGRLYYGAVDDHSPTMAPVGYASQSQLGSRNRGKTRYDSNACLSFLLSVFIPGMAVATIDICLSW